MFDKLNALNSLSIENYRTAKVRKILERQGHNFSEYDKFASYIEFHDEFKLCMFPSLLEKIKNIDSLYDSIVVSDDTSICENFYSSNIEGAKLDTLDETKSIIDSHYSKGKKRGMVIGFSNALNFMIEYKDLKLDAYYCDLLNGIITKQYSDSSHSGRRDNSVYVGNEERVVFTPCDCKLVDELYNKLFEIVEKYNPIIGSILLHFFIVWLHPYFDGNGRTARLASREYLIRNGYSKFKNISISKYIYNKLSGYYKSILASEDELDLTHFVIYMLSVYEDALEDNLN